MMELLKSLQDTLTTRIKNLLLMNFLFSWILINYDITFKVLFDEKMDINQTIQFIKDTPFNWWYMLVLPIVVTFIYIYIIPIVNLWINEKYEKFVLDKEENHKHNKKVKRLEKEEEIEKAREKIEKAKLHNSHFLTRTMENEIKSKEAETERKKLEIAEELKSRNKIMQELEESKNFNEKLKQDIKELEEQNREIKKNYSDFEDETDTIKTKLKKEIEQLEEDNREIKKSYIDIESECEKLKKNIDELNSYIIKIENDIGVSQGEFKILEENRKLDEKNEEEIQISNAKKVDLQKIDENFFIQEQNSKEFKIFRSILKSFHKYNVEGKYGYAIQELIKMYTLNANDEVSKFIIEEISKFELNIDNTIRILNKFLAIKSNQIIIKEISKYEEKYKTYYANEFYYDEKNNKFMFKDNEVKLNDNQFKVLKLLHDKRWEIVTYEEITRRLNRNRNDLPIKISRIQNIISSIKTTIHLDIIENIYNIGYRLKKFDIK